MITINPPVQAQAINPRLAAIEKSIYDFVDNLIKSGYSIYDTDIIVEVQPADFIIKTHNEYQRIHTRIYYKDFVRFESDFHSQLTKIFDYHKDQTKKLYELLVINFKDN